MHKIDLYRASEDIKQEMQWRAVTSETSHAIGMPKPGHEIGYFMGSQ